MFKKNKLKKILFLSIINNNKEILKHEITARIIKKDFI